MGKRSQRKGKEFQGRINEILSRELGTLVVTNPSQFGNDAGRDHLLMLPLCIQSQHAKRIDVYGKLKEAKASARPGELSVAILRKDRQPIIVVLSLADWLELVKAAFGNQK